MSMMKSAKAAIGKKVMAAEINAAPEALKNFVSAAARHSKGNIESALASENVRRGAEAEGT